jgi:hypothetical protein
MCGHKAFRDTATLLAYSDFMMRVEVVVDPRHKGWIEVDMTGEAKELEVKVALPGCVRKKVTTMLEI